MNNLLISCSEVMWTILASSIASCLRALVDNKCYIVYVVYVWNPVHCRTIDAMTMTHW